MNQNTCDVCGKVLGYPHIAVSWFRAVVTGETLTRSGQRDVRGRGIFSGSYHATVCGEDCESRFFTRAVLQTRIDAEEKRVRELESVAGELRREVSRFQDALDEKIRILAIREKTAARKRRKSRKRSM